jgi:copper homeostasis protein
MTIEVCVDSVEQALAAEACGAHRLELCANLREGGTTPSYGLIELISRQCSLPIYAMIRPRGGHFFYSAGEIELMHAEIDAAAQAGVKGVVFGMLLRDGLFDFKNTQALVLHAHSMRLAVTYHRAIDVCKNPSEALEALAAMGVENILTSGQATAVMQGLDFLRKLVADAEGRINIMAGGGVNPANAAEIASIGVDAIHFTARRVAEHEDGFGFGDVWAADKEKIKGVVNALALTKLS